MQNPVTGSGGMLIGRVAEIGPEHPARAQLRRGDRVATLVSLTLTPLVLDDIQAVHPHAERVDVKGSAVLFASGLWARMPEDLPEATAARSSSSAWPLRSPRPPSARRAPARTCA